MSASGSFPFPLDSGDLLVISAVLSVLTALLAVWHGLIVRDPLANRLRALEARRSALKVGTQHTRRSEVRGDLRASSLSVMRRLVAKLKLMRGDQADRIALRMARAGWRSRDAVVAYFFAKLVMPFAMAGVGVMLVGLLNHSPNATGLRLIGLAAGGVAGFLGPDLWVKNAADKRAQQMTKALPDALDLLVICAEAGLSLDAAMTRVGREIVSASPELADEFSLTAIELGFLPSRQLALQNLMGRTNMTKLRSLVNSLLQTERYGTPLAQSLRVLAAEFRDERMMRAEEKAGKLPATMTVPMIVFILPALFIVLGGPAAIRIIHIIAKM